MASTPTKLVCPQFLFFSTRWSGRHWARSHQPLCNRKDLLYPYTASTLASHADVLGAWIIFPATKTWILLTRKRIQIKYLSTMFLRSAALDRHLHANIQSISWGDCMLPCKESTFSKLPNWWNVHWDDHISWNNKAETPKERWSVGAFSNCDNCIWMKYIYATLSNAIVISFVVVVFFCFHFRCLIFCSKHHKEYKDICWFATLTHPACHTIKITLHNVQFVHLWHRVTKKRTPYKLQL